MPYIQKLCHSSTTWNGFLRKDEQFRLDNFYFSAVKQKLWWVCQQRHQNEQICFRPLDMDYQRVPYLFSDVIVKVASVAEHNLSCWLSLRRKHWTDTNKTNTFHTHATRLFCTSSSSFSIQKGFLERRLPQVRKTRDASKRLNWSDHLWLITQSLKRENWVSPLKLARKFQRSRNVSLLHTTYPEAVSARSKQCAPVIDPRLDRNIITCKLHILHASALHNPLHRSGP